MKKNFWKQSKKPFFVLAPMAEVTDVVFRDFVARHSKPDVLYTEFVACKGLLQAEGRKYLMRDFYYTQTQRPIVAQVFGGDPGDFYECAKLVEGLGFDGIDINMGCPVNKVVEKQCAGSDLIRDPKRAQEIIKATREGSGEIPVAVKTRIGYNEIETESWIASVLECEPDALIVHGRTRKEMSKVPAHWDEIAKVADMAKAMDTIVIGNGDVKSRLQGEQLARETGVDGVMIGRGVFGNPWVFNKEFSQKNVKDRLLALIELTWMFSDFWGKKKNFNILKRHVKAYVNDFPDAKELREKLMGTTCAQEIQDIVEEYFCQECMEYELPKRRPLDLADPFL